MSSAQFFETVADGRIQTNTIAGGASLCYFFTGVTGRSYAITMLYHEANATSFTTAVNGPAGSCTGVDMAGLNDNSAQDPAVNVNFGRRVSFVAPSNGYYLTQVANTGGASGTFSLTVSDTTQFSPAWSTNSTYDTFYSLLNTTNATCTGTLTLYDTAGAVVTTTAVSVTSGATFATNTFSLGTTRNKSGTARLTHNCPPGGILSEAAIANFSISPPYIQPVKFEAVREAR